LTYALSPNKEHPSAVEPLDLDYAYDLALILLPIVELALIVSVNLSKSKQNQ